MDVVPFETPSAQIPFVLMEARVNDERIARVLLDTGAAAPFAVMISPELARLSGAVRDGGSDAPSTGALGAAPVGFQSARLAEFRLGPIRLRDVSAGVTSALDAVSRQLGTRVDAIVGQRFVEGRTISIDYGAHQVDFAAAAGPPGAAVPFALAPKRPLTMIEVMLNGRGPFALALDTGRARHCFRPRPPGPPESRPASRSAWAAQGAPRPQERESDALRSPSARSIGRMCASRSRMSSSRWLPLRELLSTAFSAPIFSARAGSS